MLDLLIGTLLFLTAPLWCLLLLWRPHWRAHISERFNGPREPVDLWMHGASMGEVLALEELLKKIHEKHPTFKILVTTNTQTGRETAVKKYPFAKVQLAPFDWGPVVSRWMSRISPKLHLLSELDLWPARQRYLKKRDIPTYVAGARLSERGFSRSQKVWSFLKEAYHSVDHWGAREEAVAERLKQLGLPEDKIEVTGALKYDALLKEFDHQHDDEIAQRIDDSIAVVVAGSIHPGEEQPFIDLLKELPEGDKIQVVMAPRHPQKLAQFEKMFKSQQVNYVLWSDHQPCPINGVLLVDVMGLLMALYEKATMAFVGATLIDLGGHNVFEPTRFGVPVVVGPYTSHVKEEMRVLLKRQGVLQSPDVKEALRELLQNPERAVQMGAAAQEALKTLCGGTEKTYINIAKLLRAP